MRCESKSYIIKNKMCVLYMCSIDLRFTLDKSIGLSKITSAVGHAVDPNHVN